MPSLLRRLPRAGIGASGAALVLLPCWAAGAGGPAAEVAPTWEAYEDVVARTWEARGQGRFEDALAEARAALALLDALAEQDSVPQYKFDGTRADLRIHEEIARLSPRDQERIREADRLDARIRSAFRKQQAALAESLVAVQLETRREILGPDAYDVAESLRHLARCHGHRTRWSEADSLYRVAAEIYRHQLGERHPNLATILADRSALAHGRARREDAERFLVEGLLLMRSQGWESHPIYAYSLANLSVILRERGELARAETAARQALRLLEGRTDPEGQIARCWSALGQALHEQGRWEEAGEALATALASRAALRGWGDPDVARSRMNVAANLRARGMASEAETHMRAALATRDSLYGPESALSCRTRLSLASLLSDQERLAEAETLFARAMGTLGDDPQALRTYGTFLRESGRLAEAETAHRRALEAYRSREDPRYSKDLVEHLVSLAIDQYGRGGFVEARAALEEAGARFESLRLFAGDSYERASFEGSPYPLLAVTCLAAGDSTAAWEAVERSQARALLDLLAGNGRPLEADLAQRRRELLERLAEAERRWELLGASGASAAAANGARTEASGASRSSRSEGGSGNARYRAELLDAQAEWVSFEEERRRRHPLPGERSLPLADLIERIGPREALIGWVDLELQGLDPASWMYVVRRDGVHWIPHPAHGNRERWLRTRDALRALRSVTQESSWSAIGGERSWEAEIEAVSHDWFDPLLPLLDDVEHIVVVGTGPLDGIPVEMLETRSGRSVVERWTVSSAPSASVLAWLRDRPADNDSASRKSLLAVADPAFTSEDATASSASPLADLAWPAGMQPEPQSRGAGAWPRLSASREEVASIARHFDPVRLFFGPEASEERLLEELERGELLDYDVLHFATHAFSDDRAPGRSALVLCQTGLPSPQAVLLGEATGPDGLLRADEVADRWELDAELVVLSACQSALGTRIQGEGFVGLTHSFLLAGSRNVLASLWPVDDEATRIFMESFYDAWRSDRAPALEALQRAKRKLREHEVAGSRPYDHPRHWAAFVWIGPGD